MILSDLSKSYITNGDGSSKKSVQISAPSYDYAYDVQSAVVQGKLHLFGGKNRKKVSFISTKNVFNHFKIARLDACSLVQLPYKLNFDVYWGAAAFSISDNSEGKNRISFHKDIFLALVCFDSSNHKLCERFTGTNVVSTHSTTYSHYNGQLGFYNGKPTTVGSYNSDGYRKTETMTSTGWTGLADHPR